MATVIKNESERINLLANVGKAVRHNMVSVLIMHKTIFMFLKSVEKANKLVKSAMYHCL